MFEDPVANGRQALQYLYVQIDPADQYNRKYDCLWAAIRAIEKRISLIESTKLRSYLVQQNEHNDPGPGSLIQLLN